MYAIRFLTTVANGVHHTLFGNADILKEICEKIIIPNLTFREEDEEMFELNWVEYVRRDTEGSDSDTRRRAAAELVKSLTVKFSSEVLQLLPFQRENVNVITRQGVAHQRCAFVTQVTQLFSGYVGNMLQQYAQNPAQNWKAKDCAIYLVVALTVKGKTAAQGATTTNEFVNIPDFFNQHIMPELQSANADERPVLKADALKFVTTFRSQIPKAQCVTVGPFGDVARELQELPGTHMYRCCCNTLVVYPDPSCCHRCSGCWLPCLRLKAMLSIHMLL